MTISLIVVFQILLCILVYCFFCFCVVAWTTILSSHSLVFVFFFRTRLSLRQRCPVVFRRHLCGSWKIRRWDPPPSINRDSTRSLDSPRLQMQTTASVLLIMNSWSVLQPPSGWNFSPHCGHGRGHSWLTLLHSLSLLAFCFSAIV